MAQEEKSDQRTSAAGAAGPGAAHPAPPTERRPSVVVMALMVLASVAVAALVLLVVGWLTGDRFRRAARPVAPAGATASPQRMVRPEAARSGAAKAEADRLDATMANVLAYLAAADPGGDNPDDDHADMSERLRLMSQMFPVRPNAEEIEVPAGLALPPGTCVVFTKPATAFGPNDLLVMARSPGALEAVKDFFVRDAAKSGWTSAERGSTGGGRKATLQFEHGGLRRLISIGERPSGKECVIAIYDVGAP